MFIVALNGSLVMKVTIIWRYPKLIRNNKNRPLGVYYFVNQKISANSKIMQTIFSV